MIIKKIFIIILFLIPILLIANVYAQDTNELQQKINEYQAKLTDIRQQKNTRQAPIAGNYFVFVYGSYIIFYFLAVSLV